MNLTKKQRQLVFNKSNGMCWYCGCNLPIKGWHADHLEPIGRYKDIRVTDKGVQHITNLNNPHLDVIENIVPSCAPCNLFKADYSLEQFRREVEYQVDRARKISVNFRTAERFGTIAVIKQPITFWFEKNTPSTKEGE